MFGSKQNFFRLDEPVLKIASKEVVALKENCTCADVLRVMLDRYRRIPITSHKGYFRGFVTASDILDILGAGPRFRQVRSLKADVIKVISKSLYLNKDATIGQAIDLLKRGRRGAYPILDNKKLIGIVSEWDIAKLVSQKTGIQVCQAMHPRPMVAKDSWSIFDAAKAMVRARYRRLPVVHNKIIAGIITPKDILTWLNDNKVLSRLKEIKEPISNVMVRNVVTIGPKADLADAVKIMARAGIGGLPVVDDEVLIGIITERDIVDCIS
jgi:CBS domain-containing protein